MFAFALGLALVGEMVSSSVGATNKKNAIVRSENSNRELLADKSRSEMEYLNSQFDINRYRKSINGAGISNSDLINSYENDKTARLRAAQYNRYSVSEDVFDARYKAASESIYEDILSKVIKFSTKALDSYDANERDLQRKKLSSYYNSTYDSDGLELHDAIDSGDLINGISRELEEIDKIKIDKY